MSFIYSIQIQNIQYYCNNTNSNANTKKSSKPFTFFDSNIKLLFMLLNRICFVTFSFFLQSGFFKSIPIQKPHLQYSAISFIHYLLQKECRGALGTISQVASGLGMLIFLSIGPFLPYFELHVIYACIIATICLPLWFIPETPYYLYSKGE